MFYLLTIVIVIVAALLILVVVIQNSKGGGLAAGFASANQVMGVRKTTDTLEKGTWWLAGILVILCILTSFAIPKSYVTPESELRQEIQNAIPQTPSAVAPFGTAVPTEEAPAATSAPATETPEVPAE